MYAFKWDLSPSIIHENCPDCSRLDPIGTVPLPGTVKGMAKTSVQKVMGRHPEVLIDALGDRLAFERTGTRLYDAFLGKARVRTEESSSRKFVS